MKKKIILIVMLTLLLMPLTTLAAGESDTKYSSKNLVETLEAENIELKFEDYEETDSQITIYMFRGSGCSYCRGFLEFLNEITEEYGEYFKLESYDVWTDSNNADLLEEVSDFLGQNTTGVPLIIIGEQVFPGYSEQYNDSIKEAIENEYDNKDRYDALEEMEKSKTEAARKAFFESGRFAIICGSIVTILSTVIVILFVNNRAKILSLKIENLEKKLESSKDSHNKEEFTSKHHKEHKDKKKLTDSSAK